MLSWRDVFKVEHTVGRLLELRVWNMKSFEDADAYSRAIELALKAFGRKMVLCGDYRPMAIYPPVVSDRLVQMFAAINARVERVGLIVSSPTIFLQVTRMAAEAANPNRRVFSDPSAMTTWLSEVLDPSERSRLTAWVVES
jgi:hypothetical protein